MKNINYLTVLLSLFSCLVQAENETNDLAELDFDELMQIEITSVSKKSEKLSEAAAAVYVVTENEIRRSGATSIPEALRLVPGVDVAQIDPNKWAVSIRGFNGRLANKLLVLVDGRSVYTPTYSGVYWEYLDYLMADIDRIEVIRGPGATLWGMNAVNGVINIITKEAVDTQGGYLSLAAGNELRGMAEIRQGFEPSDNAQMRVYAKGRSLDESLDLSETDQDNGGDYLQTGMRLDVQHKDDQLLSFQGDLYRNDLRQQHTVPGFDPPYANNIANGDVEAKGGNLGLSWRQLQGLDSELNVKFNYDFYDHIDLKYNERRDTVNFELQHQLVPFKEHELVWGAGYRWSRSDATSSLLISIEDPVDHSDIWSAFIQDTIRFPEQKLSLTLGTKLERSSYSGTELQPNIRLSWVPDEQFTVWGAVSRAMRTPSRGESEFIVNIASAPSFALDPNNPLPTMMQVAGSEDFQSEQLDAYEFGIRWQPRAAFAVDLAAFYNDYSDVRSYEPGSASTEVINGETFLLLPMDIANNIQVYSQGLELLTTWQATSSSRYRLVYSMIDIHLQDNGSSADPTSTVASRTPEQQASLWGSFDLNRSLDLDLRLYYTGTRSWPDSTVNSYIDGDLRLAWHPLSSFELSLTGRNLLDSAKQETIADPWASPSMIERSVFVQGVLTW
ncbi:TonB-dependent receptor plug domain-containing protein [Psychromonas ossibalaenae]|uniref:TonB-dependent receptor plug domain-containing protein n=1 Tax=Psychromonas ossibalaenae TaxID=444922 RepID=UPI0003740905|nr:TonB-dependent receptor [Psychromonas ossibalaenae]